MQKRFLIYISIFVFIVLSYLSIILPEFPDYDIFINLRIPKYLAIILTGFSLSTAGLMLQLITKNVLAEPFIIGTSSASMLGLILIELTGLGVLNIFSFIFINLIALFFTLLSYKLSLNSKNSILLSGIAINSFVLSIIVLFVIFSRNTTLKFFHLSFGSFSYPSYNKILYCLSLIFISFVILKFLIKYIVALSFDEEKSYTIGFNTDYIKLISFLVISVLTSTSVILSGIIGFVGLMVPHIILNLYKDFKMSKVLLLNLIFGAILLLFADVINKYFFYPIEIPPGVVSSIIGSVFFLYLVFKKRYL